MTATGRAFFFRRRSSESPLLSGYRIAIYGPSGSGFPPTIDPTSPQQIQFVFQHYNGMSWDNLTEFPEVLAGRSVSITFLENVSSDPMQIKIWNASEYGASIDYADAQDFWDAVQAGFGYLIIAFESSPMYDYPGDDFAWGVVLEDVTDPSVDGSWVTKYSYPGWW